jgi:SAM-dependent methyltransferase
VSDPPPEYLAPYHRATREHGPTFRATLWASREKQIGRFEVLCGLEDLTGATVLDAGSGAGDLAGFLNERGVRYAGYLGLEGVPELVQAGRERGFRRAEFLERDFVGDERAFRDAADALGGADCVVFSGSLNTLALDDAIAALDRAWAVTRRALLFNFLSTRRRDHQPPPAPDDPARRLDPLPLLDWALGRTPNVLFRQDYFAGHDATISMRRPS